MSLIQVKNLCKSFGSLKVLQGVNLEVDEGEKIAIIGGSGCGKSVFLRSLELLEVPDSGQIFIDGEEITARSADVNRIRRKMGMVYQKFYLFSHMNVLDNLCLAPVKLLGISRKEAEEQAMDWLAKVGLTSKAHSMPAKLSGGQQQRIAICRSLMMKPKVLLFDEPTSALDPTMVGEVLAMIRMLTKHNMTMLIVTHEMNFAREVADRVLFFADGGIYEQGTPDKIFDSPEREKTIAFIRKLKYFTYDINSRHFDLLALHGGIHNFAEKYGIDSKLSYRLQLCCEELVYEIISGCYDNDSQVDINISVSYSEADSTTLINLTAKNAKKFNPFEINESDDEENIHLGVAMLKRISQDIKYNFDSGSNNIEIVLGERK
ncbi:MAG: ATP-binding cassette domain-containing protein [Synergistaceae bacterium]|nr:ATP-binding cassette domain-containing protein [Synergistaceae bacterium]